MIETRIELEQARAALAKRKPEDLADFILTLAWASNGIGAYVRAFALSEEPGRAASVLAEEIEWLREGESDYTYRHRQSYEVSARAERTLHAIRELILPRNRSLARQLLASFIDGSDDILANCYEDDDAGKLFKEAREIAESIADDEAETR